MKTHYSTNNIHSLCGTGEKHNLQHFEISSDITICTCQVCGVLWLRDLLVSITSQYTDRLISLKHTISTIEGVNRSNYSFNDQLLNISKFQKLI